MELKVSYGMIKSSSERTPLTSSQLRAGRALIRWTAEDLARASAVGLTTIRRAELTDSETSMTAANDLAVRRALATSDLSGAPQSTTGALAPLNFTNLSYRSSNLK